MDIHTNFYVYSPKIEVPIGQNREWPTNMAATLELGQAGNVDLAS